MTKSFAFILFLLAITAGLALTALRNTAHEFAESQCPDCHAVKPVKNKRGTLRMTASIQSLCCRCHGDRETLISHPVEITPTGINSPVDLPLSWEGKMTCSTCHDIHSAPVSGLGVKTYFLRRQAASPAFCTACHADGKYFAGKENGHAQVIGRAHMQYKPEEKAGRIDNVSRDCIICHDGSVGRNVNVRAGSWKHGKSLSRYDPSGSHPIGVNYLRALIKRGGLHPLSKLNSAIKLIDGMVGCISCHDPYSREQDMLVMSNAGSRLCLACHDK